MKEFKQELKCSYCGAIEEKTIFGPSGQLIGYICKKCARHNTIKIKVMVLKEVKPK